MQINTKLNAATLSVVVCSALFSSNALANNISGKVTDRQGNPIRNAEVHVDSDIHHIFTNEKGEFTLTDLGVGEVELHISAKNFNHYNQKIQLTDNGLTDHQVALIPSVMEIIDVHATPLHSSSIESAQPINVLSSDELRLKQASTLGETLKNEVGVHSTYYGPVSSSPIIRGLDGPRVLVTQNGLDVGDASRVGADHAVSSETSTATQIEVLRGPSTLFFGSGAIGGVVNVVDNRVPTSLDTSAEWLMKYNDVADEKEASVTANTSVEQFAFHVDGFWRESGEYDIPGAAEIDHDHEEDDHEEDHGDEEEHHEDEHESHGTLENSSTKATGFTLGGSYILDNGYVGFSYGRLDREYGVPGHSHGEEHEEDHEGETEEEHEEHEESDDAVRAKLSQNRYQMLSELTFNDSFINKLSTKMAFTDYQHKEIEYGVVGTQFKNKSLEVKSDFYHQPVNEWNGAFTFHYKHSDFEAVGEEAFTPPSETSSIASAWLEEKHFNDVLLQLGARVEQVEVSAKDGIEIDGHEGTEFIDLKTQDFTPISVSIGAVWDYQQGYNIGTSLSMSQRAPSSAELFSFGPHIGTSTFEIGAVFDVEIEGDDELHVDAHDQKVSTETSYNADITWRKFEGDFGFVISAFYNHANDFYYQRDTGMTFHLEHEHEEHDESEEGEEEGLPIFVYQQDNVDMYGIEAEFVYQLSSSLKATIFGDYIRGKLSDGGNLPRIPPMRLGNQLTYQGNSFSAEVSVSHYFDQNDIAEYETKTKGYTLIDANINYYLDGFGADTVLFVKGDNLTDEEARVHSSFLKNVAPLPGRGISVGIRGSF